MRLFTAGIVTETNTFAPFPTGMRGFEEEGISRPGKAGNSFFEVAASEGIAALAEKEGHELVVGLFAAAQPSGRTIQSVYEELRDEMLADLRARGPFDAVLLVLHGAMASAECDDCEGDMIRRVRELVGEKTVIGVELDPHCHLTPAMVDAADVIILMKEYPHTDLIDRARELYRICIDQAAGKVRPVSAMFDCRMVGFYPTTMEPMAGLLARMREVEKRPGILSVSFAHGFPWGDVAEVGSKMLVIADGDRALAERTARELGLEIYAARSALLPRYPSIEKALDLAAASDGLVVLADTADNAGGGAPGDNTELLRAMLARGVRDAVAGCFWDPIAARIAAEAGIGARFPLRIGGKCGQSSGAPLDLDIEVMAIRDEHDQGGLDPSVRQRMGLSVWVRTAGIDLVINSVRTQTFSPDAFTGLGISLEGKRIVAVKSSQHFYALFAPLAARVIHVATPGTLQMNFASMPYTKRDGDYFPRVADPLAQDR